MKSIAESLLTLEIQKIKLKSYAELLKCVNEEPLESYELSKDDEIYDIEFQYFWDSEEGGNIRVIGSANLQGSLSSFKPVSDDFIMTPEGTLRGE